MLETKKSLQGHVADEKPQDQNVNPLAAVYALAAQKRAEEKGTEGPSVKISKEKEVQLMYNIKNAFEEDFAKREMMQKMAGALR